MKRIYLILLLAACAFTSCNKEESLDPVYKNVELKASIEQETTRVAFTEQGDFLWTINDAIGVNTTECATSFTKMALQSGGEGESTATFVANYMSGTPAGYAVYPYNNDHSINGTTLTYNLPTSYDYTIEDNTYFVADGTGNSFNPPMWAKVENGSVYFKHLGGVLCVKVANLPVGDNQTLTVTTTNKITGEFTADLSDAQPVLETEASATDNVVTFNYSNSVVSDRVFYVPVPTGTYEKITVTFNDGSEDISVHFENKTVQARYLWPLQIGSGSIVGGEATQVDDVESANTALENGATNVVIEDIAADEEAPTIVIPNQASDDSHISITIAAVNNENAITIEEEEAEATNSAKVLNLTVPDEAVNNLVIDLPNTTVYVNGVITELTGSTGDDTLVISADAEIGKATILKGNVRIEAGGQISTLENNSGKTIYVILEDGATAPTTMTETNGDIVVVTPSQYEFQKALNGDEKLLEISDVEVLKYFRDIVNSGTTFEGYTIKLTDDIDLNKEQWTPIGFNDNSYIQTTTTPFKGTFDGNGKTISNLKMNYTDRGGLGLFGAVNSATFKNLTIENVDIKATNAENKNESGNYMVGGWIGAVAGYDTGGTITFNNVHVKGLIKIEGEYTLKSGQRVAGVIGGGQGGSRVDFDNVTVVGDEGSYIKSYCSTAGIMGQNQGVGTFNNIHVDIDIICNSFGAGGLVGIVCQGSTLTNCSYEGEITRNQPLEESKNSLYRIGGIAGCWSASKPTHTLTLTNCEYTATLTSLKSDKTALTNFDLGGYVGRAYGYGDGTNPDWNSKGSKVTIDGNVYEDIGNGQYSVGVGTATALAQAIENAEDDATITLGADIELTGRGITVSGKNITLDLAGYTIENKTASEDEYCLGFKFINSSNVTITGVGTIETICNESIYTMPIWVAGDSTVTIENGTFTGDGADGDGSAPLYVQEGTLNINGGTFANFEEVTDMADTYITVNCYGPNYEADKAKVVITGGKFYKWNPADNNAEGAGTNFVANGYSAVESGDYYEVNQE